ncbi:MAG: hypothetical protein JWL84_2628 [Rhodospirillales bacterium]|nr:hypothetical protein [Rhodospirillales bacterium]
MSKNSPKLSCVEIERRIMDGRRAVDKARRTWTSARDNLEASGKLPPWPWPEMMGPTHGVVLALRQHGINVPDGDGLDLFKAATTVRRDAERSLGIVDLYDAFSRASEDLDADYLRLYRTRAASIDDLQAKIRLLDLSTRGGADSECDVIALVRSIRRDADALLRRPSVAIAA